MLSQLIQKQIPLGSRVVFQLKSGKEVEGVLIEIGSEYVTIESPNKSTTILIDTIGSWEVKKADEKYSSQQVHSAVSFQDEQSQNSSLTSEGLLEQDRLYVVEKITRVETSYSLRIDNATIMIQEPNGDLPKDVLGDAKKESVIKIWSRLQEKYRYAQKIGETHPKFNRIQQIASETKELSNRYPQIPFFRRHLAYFYWIMGNHQEAISQFKQTAIDSNLPADWRNLSATSLEYQSDLACYGLEKYFYSLLPEFDQDAWFVFIKLIVKFSAYERFAQVIQSKLDVLDDDVLDLIVDTVMYLLLINNNRDLASNMIESLAKASDKKLVIPSAISGLPNIRKQEYQATIDRMDQETQVHNLEILGTTIADAQGYVYKYFSHSNYGFIKTESGKSFFFHRSAIIDPDLIDKLKQFSNGQRINVAFRTTQGAKGPLAVDISLLTCFSYCVQLERETEQVEIGC